MSETWRGRALMMAPRARLFVAAGEVRGFAIIVPAETMPTGYRLLGMSTVSATEAWRFAVDILERERRR